MFDIHNTSTHKKGIIMFGTIQANTTKSLETTLLNQQFLLLFPFRFYFILLLCMLFVINGLNRHKRVDMTCKIG